MCTVVDSAGNAAEIAGPAEIALEWDTKIARRGPNPDASLEKCKKVQKVKKVPLTGNEPVTFCF